MSLYLPSRKRNDLLIHGLLMTIDLYLPLHRLKYHFPTYDSSNTLYWRPSDELQKVLHLLYKEDYAQFPCVPCSYCSRLLYLQSAKWIVINDDTTYPLQTSFQINLTTNPRNPAKIAICDESQCMLNACSNILTYHIQKENIFLLSTYIPV